MRATSGTKTVSIPIIVPHRPPKFSAFKTKAGPGDDRSGLTAVNVRPLPLLFGKALDQRWLLEIARTGEFRLHRSTTKRSKLTKIEKAGLCVSEYSRKHHIVRLNGDHPAIDELCAVLSDLIGAPVGPTAGSGTSDFDHASPLAHIYGLQFRISLLLSVSGPCTLDEIRANTREFAPQPVKECIERMQREHVLVRDDDSRYRFAPGVPESYRLLVVRLNELRGDRSYKQIRAAAHKPVGFQPSKDGAPRLFGTDIRLRNLMALAKYGPMHLNDLRRIVGAESIKSTAPKIAPFGRAALVREWDTPIGIAAALDTTFPLYRPLRRLLLRLEEAYPLPPFHRHYDRPKPPPRKAWYGDRYVLFGGVLPTTTLVSIGVLGWTSEVLVCKINGDVLREQVRPAVTRLEDEGLLQASRPRGPGFNVRQLTISEAFPAKRELTALVRAYVRVWPDTARIVSDSLLALPPRAKEHLRRRGLWPYDE